MSTNPPTGIDKLLAEAGRAVKRRELDQAADLVAKVLTSDPDHIKALDLMGYIRFFQKRYGESEACCRRVLHLTPDHAYALSGLGMNLARQGHLKEGLELLTRAISVKPDWPEPYWDAAIILIESGDKARAIECLERGQIAAPNAKARFTGLITKIRQGPA